MTEINWSYGPTDWDPNPGAMWHNDCPGERGEVYYDKGGGAYCLGCDADQEPCSYGDAGDVMESIDHRCEVDDE